MLSTTCPVCSHSIEQGKIRLCEFTTGRGLSTWTRCSSCRSYFDTAPYDRAFEVEHTRTCSWGKTDTGIKLNSFKRRMFLSVLQILSRYASAGCSILDVGCSFGGFLQQAKARGFVPRGADILPEAVEYTKQQGIPCDLAASIQEIKAADNSFDVISVLDCN